VRARRTGAGDCLYGAALRAFRRLSGIGHAHLQLASACRTQKLDHSGVAWRARQRVAIAHYFSFGGLLFSGADECVFAEVEESAAGDAGEPPVGELLVALLVRTTSPTTPPLIALH
jgi:hypothetical protein